jgi:hypothetical protein
MKKFVVLLDGEPVAEVTLPDVSMDALSKPDHPLWKKAVELLSAQLKELECES